MTYRQFLEKLLKIFKVITILVPIVLLFWLVERYFVINGRLDVIQNFRHPSKSISLIYTNGYLPINKGKGIYHQALKQDKAYFKAKVPRRFHEAEVTLEYQNPDQNIFEMGVLKEGQYPKAPLEHKTLDQLDWPKREKNGLILWQKESKYKSIDKFLADIPVEEKVAYYNYTIHREVILKDYQPKEGIQEIEKTLLGPFIMYTYIKNEDLNFTFFKQDLNRHEDLDLMTITVFKEDEKMLEEAIPDDGVIEATNVLGEVQEKQILISGLGEGVYKIKIDCPNDTLIRKIKTKQHLLVFDGWNLYLAGNEEEFGIPQETVKLFTNTDQLKLYTPQETGYQTFTINDFSQEISQAGERYTFTEGLYLDQLNQIFFPKVNVVIRSTDGVFAFSQNSFFSPLPENIIKLRPDTNLEEIDYVIAQYTFPCDLGNGWKKQKVNFVVKQADLKGNQYTFALFSPGLAQPKIVKENEEEKEIVKEIKIRKIEILFKKEPITLKNFYDRLKGYIQRISKS